MPGLFLLRVCRYSGASQLQTFRGGFKRYEWISLVLCQLEKPGRCPPGSSLEYPLRFAHGRIYQLPDHHL